MLPSPRLPSPRCPARLLRGLFLGTAAAVVAGCAASPPAPPPSHAAVSRAHGCADALRPRPTPRPEGPAWIVTPGALLHLARAGLPWSVLHFFNRPSTLLLARQNGRFRLAPRATIAYTYDSGAALRAALARHQVPGNVRYLLLDLERWPLTPLSEQERPIATLRAALAAADAASRCVVFAPAVDLMASMGHGGTQASQIARFNQLIVAPAARLGDVLDVQSQQTEGTPLATVFAREAVTTSRSIQARDGLFVGLSTNPDGRLVSPADLLTLYRSGAAAGAIGYWLNIPETSPECPLCGSPQTQVAVSFLEHLARTGWTG
jgi:hypothetical protein